MGIYTRINIEVVPSYEYSYKITEEPELTYTESSGKSISILFGTSDEMKAVAEAMLKVVEYSSSK